MIDNIKVFSKAAFQIGVLYTHPFKLRIIQHQSWTHMREHHDAVTGRMHVRLDAVHTRFHRSVESCHTVLWVLRFVAAVGDNLRQRTAIGLFHGKGP